MRKRLFGAAVATVLTATGAAAADYGSQWREMGRSTPRRARNRTALGHENATDLLMEELAST
jgi:hypothetical protein